MIPAIEPNIAPIVSVSLPILVDPINKKDYWYTGWKRPIENKIKKNIKLEIKEEN